MYRPLCRSYATKTRPFIPPSQLQDIRPNPRHRELRPEYQEQRQHQQQQQAQQSVRPKPPSRKSWQPLLKTQPASPSFWTGRSVLYDNMIRLQSINARLRATLKSLNVLPVPAFAKHGLVTSRPVWKSVKEMSADFNNELTNSSHRKVLVVLNEMYGHYRLAVSAGHSNLAQMILHVVGMFESGEKKRDEDELDGRKRRGLDQFGRSYSLGRRKTSSARVWMIAVRKPVSIETEDDEQLREVFGVAPKPKPTIVTTSAVLVNNLPLAQYFPLSADRERIVRPLRVAGVLGRYNVFALVRGGGTTGQSGAVAHGIAKGLLVHDRKHERVLKAAKLTKRDPRMVERKKPGLLKARRARAWVRR